MTNFLMTSDQPRSLDVRHWKLTIGHSLVIGNWSLDIILGSTLDHINLYRLDIDVLFFEPFDGGFDVRSLSFHLETNNADFVRHTGLAHVGHDREFLAQFPNDRGGDQFGRIHEPQP